VLNIDLAPTLLELAGMPRPTSIQGRSWVPLLTGQSASVRDGFLYEYFHESGYVVPTIVALRRSRHKLVRYPGHPTWRELFDLATDSKETRNLVNDPGSQSILRTMEDALDAEVARVGYRVPPYADPVP
jgi:N-acetylglucosamine-6-sulfatase